MNSLNLLSAHVTGQISPSKLSKDRRRSYSDGTLSKTKPGSGLKRSASQHVRRVTTKEEGDHKRPNCEEQNGPDPGIEIYQEDLHEKIPLLSESKPTPRISPRSTKLRLAARRLVDALAASLKWVLSTLASPGVYFVTGFYDEKGKLSPWVPIRKLGKVFPKRNGRKSTAQAVGLSGSSDPQDNSLERKSAKKKSLLREAKSRLQATDSLTGTSESETDVNEKLVLLDSPREYRAHLKSSSSSEEVPQTRRSVRIKLNNEGGIRRRKQGRGKGGSTHNSNSTNDQSQPTLTVATIKSPTSPTSSLKVTKFAQSPTPPRPLIPRRQPSYSAQAPRPLRLTQKTLVIDLDETLIHSLAKGGRMSSGHMVEVKLNTTVGYGGATLGPQHPILYYVHKRPHCDDFLRRVCKWYNLVIFTASVQEYADPVIDWLEQERKYFSGRFYRQHCTFRNGAYIKDLSSVEPNLSKVMILDNSPLSYIFHEGRCSCTRREELSDQLEDNAIPIEGWINDPTDNDLLHLVPILEALQYVTDVRALLALRRGEVNSQH